MIIIEGMDNSGKSTLARILAQHLGWTLKESEGPPRKSPGDPNGEHEINDRVRRYLSMDQRVVMVRHPCISNRIYGILRDEGDAVQEGLRQAFFNQPHVMIYCDPLDRGMSGHKLEAHDTKEHMDALFAQYARLLQLYREWGAQQADICYHIGKGVDETAALVKHLALMRNMAV